jgi:Fungal fucose-specific lectin
MGRNFFVICFIILAGIKVQGSRLEVLSALEAEAECGSAGCVAAITSSVSWTDSAIHIRVYKALKGQITERCWDGSGWYTGQFSQPGLSSSSVSWLDARGAIHIRVYVSDGTNIQEWAWDGSWTKGAALAAGLASSAVSWTKPQLGIRVYVNNVNNNVVEYCYDGNGWYIGAYT